MSFINIQNLSKTYDGHTPVLSQLNMQIEKGHLISLLGPSGCGKSTLLRILAGFESISSGTITIDGEDISALPPGKRQIGMVFQQYSLFPTMNVTQNIAFGLKMKGLHRHQINEKVREMIELVGLEGREKHHPAQLSGGQKQRVALARALITEPRVLLLDEPLSAIDAQLRRSLQQSIRNIQKKLGITTVFVTHDQDEAMLMSDVIHVMNAGQIEQSDVPVNLYTKPSTRFVASFMGRYNLLPQEKAKSLMDDICSECLLAIRPETIELHKAPLPADRDLIQLSGTIRDFIIRGNVISYQVETGGTVLRADELYRSFNLYQQGDPVYIAIERRNCLEVN